MTARATMKVGQFGRPTLSKDDLTITVHIPISPLHRGSRKQVVPRRRWSPLAQAHGKGIGDDQPDGQPALRRNRCPQAPIALIVFID